MNCETVMALLPLWIEGDLDSSGAGALATHLDRCEPCRAAATALRESQTWLRRGAEPPFGPADFSALRAEVMTVVRQEPAPRSARRRYLVPLAMASAAVAAISLHHRPVRSMPSAQPANVVPEPPQAPPVASRKVAGPPPHPPRAKPIAPAAPEAPAISRIEYQTADPTIRIIWLAQADRPGPDAIPTTR